LSVKANRGAVVGKPTPRLSDTGIEKQEFYELRFYKETIALCFLAVGALPGCCKAENARANTLRELNAALAACVKGPATSVGSEITIVFSLRRDGSLLGKPKISYSKLGRDEAVPREFVGAVLAQLSHCFPVNISDGLGGAIAGHPIRLRIESRPKEMGV
jgi:hypothetical protein